MQKRRLLLKESDARYLDVETSLMKNWLQTFRESMKDLDIDRGSSLIFLYFLAYFGCVSRGLMLRLAITSVLTSDEHV